MKLHEIKIRCMNREKTLNPACEQVGVRRYYKKTPSKGQMDGIFKKIQNSKHVCAVFGAMGFNIEIEVN